MKLYDAGLVVIIVLLVVAYIAGDMNASQGYSVTKELQQYESTK